jgi:hypothetical protein
MGLLLRPPAVADRGNNDGGENQPEKHFPNSIVEIRPSPEHRPPPAAPVIEKSRRPYKYSTSTKRKGKPS